MLTCEHFLYGLFNGVGYKTIKSPAVGDLLTPKNLIKLISLPARTSPYVHWLETEKLVALSKVSPAADEYGRTGVWNHTILVNITDYIIYTQVQPAITLQNYFFKKLPSPKVKLEPLKTQ